MKHISSSGRLLRANPCQFYRKNTQDCWLGSKYISCDQLEEQLLKTTQPCSNIRSPHMIATTTTKPHVPICVRFNHLLSSITGDVELQRDRKEISFIVFSVYSHQTGQLSTTNSLDFNSPPIILIRIFIITLLVTLIVFSTTVIIIYSLGHCRKVHRPVHYTSKSCQTKLNPYNRAADRRRTRHKLFVTAKPSASRPSEPVSSSSFPAQPKSASAPHS
ncbi:unnamed protein product [Adineta ricciae]|uniref:Uncharacterized protein n=1 Tax=Adineta ricciae TaxID=249248 RepID=A0A815T6Z9_ADIRI|nr:unnamed protein product [Adineta ricciae]CAF1500757.1 unnamed protein product [Adineta ricciae]